MDKPNSIINTDSTSDSSSNKNDKSFKQSILNINNINLLPVVGMNVYDILKFNNLIISKDALVEVEKKLI